jgi:hypothetical protein
VSVAVISSDARRLLAYLYGCEKGGRRPGYAHVIGVGMDPPMTELQVLASLRELADAGMVEPPPRLRGASQPGLCWLAEIRRWVLRPSPLRAKSATLPAYRRRAPRAATPSVRS